MSDHTQLGPVLDRLCPMHLLLNAEGKICRVGPTLRKLRPGTAMEGQGFLDLFELTRPRAVRDMRVLLETSETRLHLRLRDAPHTGLKGLLVPAQGGAIVNLSFGISVLDAVRDYALSSADFSATDLTIEMLYLVEAKSAAMEASRQLNQRLQGAMIAAEERAYTDTLTGLKNRRAMDHILGRLTGAKAEFALMQLDLDYFKQVNDTLGHAAGDHVLQHVARVMLNETRAGDTVVRIGGDEFVLIFNRLSDTEQLSMIAERLIAKLGQPIPFDGHDCCISASIGIALSGPTAKPAHLLHRADVALYAAKGAGRSCHRFYSARLERRQRSVTPP